MKKLIFVLIANILFTAGYVAGGPVELGRISSEANWLVRIDCEQFIKSNIGKILRTELVKKDGEQRLSNFAEVFGFHPLDDVHSFMLYGQGDAKEKAVLLIEGEFNKDRLLALIGMNSDYKKFEYSNTTIHQWLDKGKNAEQDTPGQMTYGCFYQDDLIILGSGLPAVKHAIEVLKGSASSASNEIFSDTLLQKENAFLQVAAKDLPQIVGDKPEAAILRQAEQLIIVIGSNEKEIFSTVVIRAKSEEAAGYINNMIEGITAYLGLVAEDRPELAELAQKIQVSNSGKTIQVGLELKSEVIQQIILNHIDKIEQLK